MPRSARRRCTKALVLLTTLSLTTALCVAPAAAAAAAGTVLFQNAFNNRTVDGTGTVTLPTPTSGTNAACLTASGNSATLPLLSCSGSTDAQGSGKLRLTSATANQVGGIFGQTSYPTSSGLDVTFTSYQWGGTAADGLAFLLAAVNPASQTAPTTIGPSGGSLGYSSAGSVSGVPNGYLGVGLDVFGNFSSTGFSGSGCAANPNISTTTAGAVVVRGPGNGGVGYCGLTTTYNGTAGSKVALRAATRAASAVPVQVLVNPTTGSFTSDSGVSVAAGTYKVVATPVGQSTRTLSGALPVVPAGMYPSAAWLGANGVPKQLAFGFVGSTGAMTDAHEISNVKVLTFKPVPQLAVTTTSYAAATSQPGDPVSYKVTASVLAGVNETSPISVTQTVPTGVVPAGAYGTGWVCANPVGESITCTTSGSSFTNGTALPVITVVAIVTSANVTSALVQSNSPATATSADANPATDTTSATTALPAGPSGILVVPSSGSVAGGGGVLVGGTNVTLATAIEIGTTAEQNAGTPVVLLPCPGASAPGCFTVVGNALYISPMPARPGAATVSVTVVILGRAAAGSYVYADRPATPAAPTATAGITSATVTWVAPATNGSAITSYVITPYLAGVAQSTRSFDTTATSRTLTGLTAGGSYTFTVSAVNAYGTSPPSAASAAVVPYALPGTPSITAVSAGSLSATLTWNAPADNGSAITGYRVTPYIAGVAQTPQTFSGAATTRTVTGLTAGTTYTFVVAATNLAGTGANSAQSSAVVANQSPSLAFPAPPAGEVGVAYSRQLTATNGTSPYAWSVSAGALPGGLTLNATTGLLAGTPTAAGSFSFTVQVVDASGLAATKAVTIVIAATPTLAFNPAAGEVGVAYSQQPAVTGGTGPFAWAISAGSLPAGLSLNATTGSVGGTPTASGSYPLTVTATDSFGQVAARTVTVVIAARPTFDGAAPPAGQVGVAYSTIFAVTGGTAPITWAVPTGALPPGLTFNTSTGTLSGTPTTVGSSSFTVSVTDAFGQTANRAVTLVVGAGPLIITKTANVSTAAAGSTVAYTITVANTGTSAWTGATLTDPLTGVLDDAAYDNNATTTAGTVSYSAPNLGWTGNIAAGGTVTINYSVTVNNPDTGNKVLANTATSTTLGTNCASGSTDALCSATVTVPGLAIAKTADSATTTPGSVVRFTIVVTNTGQTAYPAVALTDNLTGTLDDATYRADATASSGNLSYTSPALTWTGALAVGATATITYSVIVADPDTGNRSLTGTVVSASAGSPCPSGNPAAQCTATVTVLVPALSITNSANVSATTPGGTVAYTVTLANTGQTPYSASTVRVALAGALDDATYNGDVSATAGAVSVSGSTLTWTGNLAVGATVTITASVTVRNPDPGDKALTTTATSTVPGSTCPTGSANTACATSVAVLIPGLTIATAANVGTATPGATVRYTVSITNSGQTPATGATTSSTLSGLLDDASYNSDAAATGGAVSVSGQVLTWTGDLAVGATATVSFSVTVNDPDAGDRTLRTRVSSTTSGTNCPAASADTRCVSSVTVLIPAVTFTTVADTETATPSQVVRYTVTATNTGETTYRGLSVTLDLAGALDDAAYNYDATISTGDLVTNPDGTAFWVLDLAPGASAVGQLSLTVSSPATGDRSLHVITVADQAGSACRPGSGDAGCRSTVTVLIPGLTITKTANTSTVSPGGTVEYTVAVVNTGESAYSDAGFTDRLDGLLIDAAYGDDATTSTGAVSYSAPVLAWHGALAPGATATITYSVTVRDPVTGDKHLANTVVSTSAGSNCPAGGTDARCTATVDVLVPGLTVMVTANAPATTGGAVVTFTVTATNSGGTDFGAAAFTNSLAGVLDDASYNADAAASVGTVGYSAGSLSWTGALAAGASAVITYSVTVHLLDGGDDLATTAVSSTTAGTNCLIGNSDTRCTATVAVGRLILSQWATETTTTPGSVVHVTVTYENTGQTPYTDISVVSPRDGLSDDTDPAGDQTASSGILVRTAEALTWTGDIPVGGTVTITRTLIVQDPDLGDRLITATLSSTAPGNNCPAATTDPLCTFLVTVLVPGLTVTKTASTTATVPGGTVTYTITAHNTGQTPYVATTLTDPFTGLLDDAVYDNDATTTAGTLTVDSSGLSWTGDLATDATVVITYSVTANSPATGDKTMANVVTSTAVGSTCLPGSGNAACRRTIVVLTPALTIVKTANLANATLGTTVTYTVDVLNSGQTTQPAAAFADALTGVLDDAAYNNDATATRGTVGYSAGVLTWSGGLASGDTATVTYTMRIRNSATGDLTMRNTVTSTTAGNNCTSGSDDTRCTATVAITEAVSATFTKTADREATVAGDVVTYTVTVTNSSASALAAEFTDPLAGILDDATYNNDATPSSGTVGYAAPNLTWSGTVATGATVTVTYTVTVGTVVTGDQRLVGTVTSTTPSESNNCAADSADPRCTNTVPVAALSLEQHYTETSTTPGSLVHLTARFTNTGQLPYTGITVSSPSTDTLDDAIPTGDQVASSGDLVLDAAAITWTGDIPVGGVVTITGTLTVKNTELGNKILTGTLASAALGNTCPAASPADQCVAYLPVLVPGLSIAKTADTTSVTPGDTVAYTVAIHNTGATPYAGATVSDDLAGVLDDATYNADAITSTGMVTFTSPILTWTGDLAPGDIATVTYSVTARDPATGDRTMLNPVTSSEVGNTCPPASGTPACRSVVSVLTPILTISSAASVATTVPGATVGYTLTVTNSGQTAYSPATLAIPLDGVLDDATYGADAAASTGTVSIAGETLTWTGSLALDATATITYSVTVDQPVTGDFLLAQTVTSPNRGSICPEGGVDPRCTTSVAVAGLRIVNSADSATTQPTAVVRNIVTVTNTGQVPYVGLTISDNLAGFLDDATYNGDATATFGGLQLEPDTGRIVWTGDLPVGETLVVTGSVTVNNPDLGDKTLTTLVTTAADASNCPEASPGAECATSVTVLTPGLTVTKAADTVETTPGATVGYTITVTNSGETAYAGATVRDSLDGVLPDAAYNDDATATTGTMTYAEPTLSWTGDLAVGQTVVISYTVRVQDLTLGDKLMVNVVLSDQIGSNCPTGGSAPDCSTLVTILLPVLDIAVTSDRTTTVPGASVGYTVTIRDTGQTDYPGATVSVLLADVLDDAAYGADASTSTGAVTFADSTLTWTGDLTVGADTVTIGYTVTVDDPPAGDRQLVTTVTSPAPGGTCGTAPQCANTVTVLVPGLAVTTSADVATATPGDRVVLTITATNTGQTPYTGTTITTALTDTLDDAEFDGTSTASSGVVTYTEPDLSWTGTLAVGATVTITYAVTIRTPDPGDKVLSTTVVAPAQGSSCLAGAGNPACTATVTVLVPSLSIGISASSATTVPGAVVTYTVTIDNDGQTAYSGAVVDDSLSGVLPDAAYNGDAVASSGVLAYTEPTLTWTGDLAIGAGATITYSVTVDDPDPGDKLLVNTLTSTAPGSTCPPGATLSTCAVQVRVLVPALVITKSADRSSVVAGDPIGYTVVLTNTGQTPYAPATFSDSLTDVLDGATYSSDAVASVGTVEYLNGTIVWTGALAVGETATITYSVTTLDPAPVDRLLLNTVSSTTQGATCRAAAPCGVEVAVLVPALTITKTTDLTTVVAGGTVHYTVAATNTGEADYPAATLSDSLADVLAEATYNDDATVTTGALDYAGGTLSWTGELPRGASVLITYSVTTATGAADGLVLTNRIVSTSNGSTCVADSVAIGCTASVAIAARTITLTDPTSSFTLTGLPNSTVGSDGKVTMTVTTNSTGGYLVTVQAATGSLTGATPGNTTTIPVGLLGVRETGTQPFLPLSADTPLTVHQQDTPSGPGGDAVSNDYRIQIPSVPSDTYSTTLDYIVSAQ